MSNLFIIARALQPRCALFGNLFWAIRGGLLRFVIRPDAPFTELLVFFFIDPDH